MDIFPTNIRWLIPEEISPCDIYLQFRGKFAQALLRGQPISFDFLEKVVKAQYSHVYIRSQDLEEWETWKKGRHPASQISSKDPAAMNSQLYGNKRIEILSYIQKVFHTKREGSPTTPAFKNAIDAIQKVTQSSMLDWYFQKFHEPPELLHHNIRVAFSIAMFNSLYGILEEKELEDILFSAIVHELEGDPKEKQKTVVSVQTLDLLEKQKIPVPQTVINLIKLHDELVSGAGFPNKIQATQIPSSIRIFSLSNHFDHYRIGATGTRRLKFEHAKKQMEARISDYDAKLFRFFWDMWEQHMELVG